MYRRFANLGHYLPLAISPSASTPPGAWSDSNYRQWREAKSDSNYRRWREANIDG